jgi:hypothetical protein
MAKRTPQTQTLHDSVIQARQNAWRGDNRYLQSWTNPDSQHNATYRLNGVEQYPDLIINIRGNNGPQLNLAWFNLLVPAQNIPEAKTLAKGILLCVVGYSADARGQYVFGAPQTPGQ